GELAGRATSSGGGPGGGTATAAAAMPGLRQPPTPANPGAAGTAGGVVHPGQASAVRRPYGAVRMALELVRREGVRGLYAGLSPALVRHIFYTGTRITVYERLRQYGAPPAEGSGGGGGGGLAAKLAMGLTAGAVGQAVAVPADLVKVRLQAEGRLVASGKLAAPRFKGMWDCLRQIVAAEGVAGLWRGGGPAVQRAALVNLGELATYDQAKQAILASGLTGGDNVAAHAASSVCSGFFASVVSVPADVVKTRMMSQAGPMPPPQAAPALPLGAPFALPPSAGRFLPTWARLGPWQLVFWTTYEQARKACDLGAF
ncbi:Mitochondrial uncoupling protein 4, partial [Tetrabaena socialis]